MKTMALKTYENWKGNLDEYLEIGDEVDEGIVDHFISVLPPATLTSRLIQIGEPYDIVDGRYTYMTIENRGGRWYYCGTCHRGSTKHVEREGDVW